MKRYLIPQMLHEWRSNLWLGIELMVVGAVICSLSLTLIFLLKGYALPLGFDPEDVFTVSLRVVDKESPQFITEENDPDESVRRDTQTMLSRLRSNPHVEAVAISMNATPFVMNWQGNEMTIEGLPDSIRYYGNLRHASPDIVRVLKLNSETGLPASEIESRLRKGEILISPSSDFSYGEDSKEGVEKLIGKRVRLNEDTAHDYRVGDIITFIRRNSYEQRSSGMMLIPIEEASLPPAWNGLDLILRVKKGEARQFIEEFNSNLSLRHQKNVILYNLQSLNTRKYLTERTHDIEVRMNMAMLVFFLIIVFLGLLGSFWLRVQQRSGEIALRKVAGARNSDIFRRLISEGTILLISGFIPGVLLFLLYVRKLYDGVSINIWQEIWIGTALSYVIMQMIILLGVFFPAKRAMSVEPAIALKDE